MNSVVTFSSLLWYVSSVVFCDTFEPGIADTFEPVAIRFKLGVVRYVSAWYWRYVSSLVLCDTFEPVAIRFKLGVEPVAITFQAWCCAIRFSLVLPIRFKLGAV